MRNRSGFALPAVILGVLLLGLAGIGVYWFMNQQPPGETVQTQPVPKAAFDLMIESPTDETLVDSQRLVVKGKTAPNATVSVYTENDEEIVQSDARGMFEAVIDLSSGLNSLVVTAFSENGEEKTVSMDVVYDET